MIIKGKEIKPEKVSMWVNVLGFLVGILFYVRMEVHNSSKANYPTIALHDSVLAINTELQLEVKHLKATQDSLINDLQATKIRLVKQKKNVSEIRQQIQHNLNSDWQSLSAEEQSQYINQITNQPKK